MELNTGHVKRVENQLLLRVYRELPQRGEIYGVFTTDSVGIISDWLKLDHFPDRNVTIQVD